ncbi:3-isopropylmalate dehydrogenase [Paramyrothecium foliicola]|nr:3-isopropylmalate dehydrogenase [Paramyrothecium foliicola]
MASSDNARLIRIALLPGDNPGPQLASYVKQTLNTIQKVRRNLSFNTEEHIFGGAALHAGYASALPQSTLKACQTSDAVLLCACGDKRFGIEPEKGLLRLREQLGAYANVRSIKLPSPQLAELSAFRAERVEAVDVTFVRDLTGGIYYGDKKEASEGDEEAYDTTSYTKSSIERLARWAGNLAMLHNPPKPVHSIDKANVMATSRLWRSATSNVFKQEFPDVPLDHILVDTAAMMLSSKPTALNGIVLTENMFGDILSDQASGMLPSQDLLASASVSALPGAASDNLPGMFEPLNLKPREKTTNPTSIIQTVSQMLELSFGLVQEAEAMKKALRRTLDPIELIGSNVRTVDLGGSASADEFMAQFLEHLEYNLEAVNSLEMASSPNLATQSIPKSSMRAEGKRPMGVVEKIMTNAGIGLRKPCVVPGEMICVRVDWTVTSELLWGGMEKTYDQMKRPRLYRNDRLWLAVDHTVDPRSNHLPRQRGLIEKAEKFKREAKIIDYLPANTSIMHTDFTRERAQPGQIVVGSDSHTCSAGSMGSLAIGFGAADVVMPMVTGETWFRVPEICRIDFVGQLPFGVGGKDVILHILGVFKRNTIAFQRAVEYGGPGLAELSMDARFAIANMTTEFGGMGACFEADEHTATWIAGRSFPEHRDGGLYFRPDPEAQYAERRVIDLSEVKLTMALYPNPDNVVTVSEKAGMKLDGCFIGACTTTEEDLVLGALVLEAGLKAGLSPVIHGKRRVTPGSLTIIKNLDRLGVLDFYRRAGFDIGAPGCSYCVGINDVDVAGEGEVWLSSQNRNFRNRMGKGSFGNITCSAAVAASSFTMTVTDPSPLLRQLDRTKVEKLLRSWKSYETVVPTIHEPAPEISSLETPSLLSGGVDLDEKVIPHFTSPRVIKSKVQRFGENVDTDAIIPAEFMPGVDDADLGSHCFQYYRPEFREKARNGSRIIVAQHGFGSGSSREDAVRALKGAGIEAVIAQGFAFIYERNQLNMGLFNVRLQDEDFYAHVHEDSIIEINKDDKTIRIEGISKVFSYQQSQIEETLLDDGGVIALYKQYGKKIFRQITTTKVKRRKIEKRASVNTETQGSSCGSKQGMDW